MRLLTVPILIIALSAFMAYPVTAQHKLDKPLVDHVVRVDTTKGPIFIKVYFSVVPYTASNFLNLVSRKFYDGLTFHRVQDWLIQGGDPNGNGSGNYIDPDTGKPRFLRLEISRKLHHDRPGMVAMARSTNPNSASCQFYIIKEPKPQLDGQYAVFGEVVDGMQAVNNIQIGDRILSARLVDNGAQDGNSTPAQQNSAVPQPVKPKTNDSGF